ncbi:MAG: aminopeptidase [Euryarchaeota archaeon]|nr:aminopeptidase [Euryarchaeota archaeon]
MHAEKELERAAQVAVRDVLGVKKGEKALIITNPEQGVYAISLAVYDAIIDAGGLPVIIVQPYKTQLDFAEDSVLAAIGSVPDIAISLSAEKLGKDTKGLKAPYTAGGTEYNHIFDYLLHGEKKIRSFWSPSITLDMFVQTVPIDYKTLRHDCGNLRGALNKAKEARVTAPAGTDITVGLAGREANVDDGDFRKPGTGGNLPAGEVYISPELGKSRGVIFFDGSMSVMTGDVVMKEPIRADVEGGFVTKISGGEEASLLQHTIEQGERTPGVLANEGKLPRESVEEYTRNARNLGELGIGLNRAARIVGNMLEDEKVYSTCHIAIGSNYDEDAKAMIHLDGLIKSPTIDLTYANGAKKRVMEGGKLTVR